MISDLGMSGLMTLVVIKKFLNIRHQQNFTASQPIKLEFKFDGVVPNDRNGYSLVLTNKLVSVSSDGQLHFDLI